MSSYSSNIDRLQREIARLKADDSREMSKEIQAQSKAHKALQAISSAKTLSTQKSKMSELERATKDSAAISKKRADIAKKIADKSKQLSSYQQKQIKADELAVKKVAQEQKRLSDERTKHEAFLKQSLNSMRTNASVNIEAGEEYDFFISHASEDKEAFVQDLAAALRELGAKIFYDAYTLKVGDSLRRKIDQGLANSKFGIVVLSEHFFSKQWPARELDGLTAMEIGGQTRILPIWHKVSYDEVRRFSPALADKVALNTSLKSVHEIAKELHSLL